MQLTQEVMDLADHFFDQLRAAGASEELITDLAMTLIRHAGQIDQPGLIIPFPIHRRGWLTESLD